MASTFQNTALIPDKNFVFQANLGWKLTGLHGVLKQIFVCDIKDEISIKKSEVYECYIQANSKPICITTT